MNLQDGDIFLEEAESRNGHSAPTSEAGQKPPVIDVVLEIAAQHRRVLISIAGIALVVCTAVAFLIPPQYESTTMIMPPEGPNPAAMLAAITGKLPAGLADLAGGMIGVKNTGPLWMNLLTSRTILDDQIDRFNLMKVYGKKYRVTTRKKLLSRTDISEDHKSGVISITVSDTDRGRARDLANGYIDDLNKLLANVSTSAAHRERMFIEQRLGKAKNDLEAAELAFGQFASKNSTFDLHEQTRAMVGAGAQLEGQIIAAQSELEGLEQIYTNDNIRVRSVRARIASLQREMTKLGGSSGSTDQPDKTLAPGALSPPIRQLPIVGVQWTDLYRQAKIQETVYELLTQQYELAKIQEAKETPTVKVIDPANYPEKKSWPPRPWIISLGPLLCLAGAIVWFKFKQDWEALPAESSRKVRASKLVSLVRNNHIQNPPAAA
jgi:uncharacterized protein involved in exopolysaccharide biosynthesis